MTSIKEFTKNFVPKKTLNISDLPSVPVDAEIMHDGEGADAEGKEFKYSYLKFNDVEYRVPGVVIGDLKIMLNEKPDMKSFKVKRTGTGKLDTRYTIIPLT